MTATYRLADLNIRITTACDYVHRMCAAYRVDDDAPVDFALETTEDDARFESERTAREDEFTEMPSRHFPLPYLEMLAVYRKVAERLPDYDGFLMHGSCLAVDGCAYLFTAKSGTGKSTHARLWRETMGDRVVMVNDDKPLIRIVDGVLRAYGTPWDGKHRLSTNISVPLRAICILERGEENRIEPIAQSDAYLKLVQQIYRPLNVAAMAKTLGLIDRVCASVGLYRLACNMDPAAALVSYEAMKP